MARDFEKPRRSSSRENYGGDSKRNFKSKFSRKDSSKPASSNDKGPFRKEKSDDKPRSFKRFDSNLKGGAPFKRSGKPSGDRRFGKPTSEGKSARFGGKRTSEGDFKDTRKPRGERSFGKPSDERSERSFKGKRNEGTSFSKGPRGGKGFGKPRDAKPEGPFRERKSATEGFKRPGFKPKGTRNFDKPVGEGGDRFFRGKPFTKPTRKKADDDNTERKSFVQSRLEKQRPRISVKKKDQVAEKVKDGLTRLNKFIANSGVCSRREADDLIKMGLITVNGQSVTEMGFKVKAGDDVRYEGKKLTAEKPVYILLNKPKGFITTTDDPQERKTIMNLIANACSERVYPVGRLDRNTTGLLLLTNDGELADKLTHPSYNVKKIYKAELDRPLTKADLVKIQEGVRLEEGRAQVDDVAIVSEDGRTVGIELHIGWNRIVRRIFESLGYAVEKLDRVVYAGLDKKDLGRGEWRFLKTNEIVKLKHLA